MSFRIVQISDTHLSAAKPVFVANFDCVGRAIAAERADLVVNSGDVSLDGLIRESDLVEAKQLHDALDLPMRFIPGNHDVGDNLDVTAAEQDEAINGERLARYRRHFGPDWWRLDAPGWRIVGVNAQLFGADLDAAGEQEAFVAASVAGADGRRIALFTHKPLFDRSASETEGRGRFLDPLPRERLLAAFGAQRPALVASGHVHQYRDILSEGMQHVWAPSTAFVVSDKRQPRYGLKQVGYVVHELHADGRHESWFATAQGARDNDLGDFPEVYGPMD
jgi:3',5'-cyclic-AMP phosphodiesterase